MKIFALSSFLTYSAIAGAAFLPAARLRRDVSELALPEPEYLPPAAAIEYLPPNEAVVAETTPAELLAEVRAEAPADDAAVLGEQGYEYRTVRRLKLRQRRDVSHLGQHYLPPHNEYLPPAAQPEPEAEPEPKIEAEPQPIEDTEEVVAAGVPQPKLANEYLPPVAAAAEAETEAPATEAAAPATEPIDAEPEEPAARFVDVPQDTAVLLDDGYHYKQPEEVPALKQAATEYLPPLSDENVAVEGPDNGESAVLAADGYHYRAVKRYRF